MEPTIQKAAGGNAEAKSLKSPDLMKLIDAATGTVKDKDAKSTADGSDLNVLAPFLQLLNQQMSLLFTQDKQDNANANVAADADALIDGQSVIPGQSGLLEQNILIALPAGQSVKLNQLTAGIFGDAVELIKDTLLQNKNISSVEATPQSSALTGLTKEEIASLTQILAQSSNMQGDTSSATDQNISIDETIVQASSVNGLTKEEILTMSQFLTARENQDQKGTLIKEAGSEINLKNNNSLTDQIIADIGKDQASPKDENEKKEMPENNILKQNAAGLSQINAGKINLAGVVNENHPASQTAVGVKVINTELNESKPEKGKKQIFSNSPVKDPAPENIPVMAGDKNISNSDDFKNRLNALNNSQNVNLKEENSVANDSPRFSTHDAKNLQSIKDAQIQNISIQKSNPSAPESANSPIVEIGETIQALRAGLGDKLKTDAKIKYVEPAKIADGISTGSLNAASGTMSKPDNVAAVDSTEIIRQVANEIKENVGTDGGRIKIVLNPPSLGSLEMDVIVRNNKVEVVLTANNKDVQQVLNNNIDQLKNTLQHQGLTIERCDVFMQDKHDEFYRSFGNQTYYQDRSGRGGKEGRQQKEEEKTAAIASMERKSGSISRVSNGTETISFFA